jgi:hypothetical protein
MLIDQDGLERPATVRVIAPYGQESGSVVVTFADTLAGVAPG